MLAGLVCEDSGGMRKPVHRVGYLVLATTGAAAVLVGCSAEGSDPPSDLCKVVDALDSAVTQINQSPLTKSTTEAVEASLASVNTAVTNMNKLDEPQFEDELNAVDSAATQLDKTASAAVDAPTGPNTAAARASMSNFTTEVKNLSKSTADTC